MAQQLLNVGSSANDGTGDTLRAAMIKTNENFTELYNSPLLASGIIVEGNEIRATRTNDDLVLTASGTGFVTAGALKFKGTSISSDDSTVINVNDNLNVDGTLTASSFAGDGSSLTGITVSAVGDLSVVGTAITAPTNADIVLTPGGQSVQTPGLNFSGNNISATRTNDDVVLEPSGTGGVRFTAITINDNNIEGTRSNEDITITPAGTGSVVFPAITFNDNNITGTRSNEDINLIPAGTGTVTATSITIDQNLKITDNEISTLQSNSDIVLAPASSGQVVVPKADIDSGAIDNTTIGAGTPSTGVFTTLTATTSLQVDGVTISDNEITANASNSDLVLTGSGTGGVTISGFTFPTTDGSNGQFLKTNGAGVLSFATAGVSLSHSAIADGSTSLSTSATSNIDTFSASTFRSAKYVVSAFNTADSRTEIFEANITHDGSNAFISTFGSTLGPSGNSESMGVYSADIDSGSVRFRVTPRTSDAIAFKFQRIAVNV